MSGLIVPETRILYVTTANTGGTLNLTVPEGVGEWRRVDPHGVLFQGPPNMSIAKGDLPAVARFFAAAAMALGVDINEGWDAL